MDGVDGVESGALQAEGHRFDPGHVLSLAKTVTDRRINSLEPYFPSLIWYNFLPGSACFSSGAEPCFAFSVAAGVLFWRISHYANRSPF